MASLLMSTYSLDLIWQAIVSMQSLLACLNNLPCTLPWSITYLALASSWFKSDNSVHNSFWKTLDCSTWTCIKTTIMNVPQQQHTISFGAGLSPNNDFSSPLMTLGTSSTRMPSLDIHNSSPQVVEASASSAPPSFRFGDSSPALPRELSFERYRARGLKLIVS